MNIGLKSISVCQSVGLVADVNQFARCQVVVRAPYHGHHQSAFDVLGGLHLKCDHVTSLTGTGDMKYLFASIATTHACSGLLLADGACLLPTIVPNLANKFDR
jgi:hypothetical protein